jgi:hypothetical protein
MCRKDQMTRAPRFHSLKPWIAYTHKTPDVPRSEPMIKIMILYPYGAYSTYQGWAYIFEGIITAAIFH